MLLDLALALSILLLMFAIVWPAIGRNTNRAQQAATALDVATLLRTDRTSATRNGRPTATRIDLARRVITGASGRSVNMPRDIAVELTTASQCVEGSQRYVIVFAADGSSCGGVLTLKKGREISLIRINWLSGMIDVVNAPST